MSCLNRVFVRFRVMLLPAAILSAIALVACGGAASPTATSQPPTSTASSASASMAPTATATAVPTTARAAAPKPQSPAGTIVIGLGSGANSGKGVGSVNDAQRGETEVFWGAAETLFTATQGANGQIDFGQPWLAKSWTVAPDLSKVTIDLQQGVQFQDGYGEMTADDVAWSVNDANSAVTTASIHAQAGDLAHIFGKWTAVDKYTIDAPFTSFDPRWMDITLCDCWQVTAIYSKKFYDDKGVDYAKTHVVATGAFEVTESVPNDHTNMKAFAGYWGPKPKIQNLNYRIIPDETTRVAALKTGEIDISGIDLLKDAQPLLQAGFKEQVNGGSELNIPFAGNLWETSSIVDGKPLERPGLDPSKPYIGDPSSTSSMENARLVRWALSMAIDRKAMVQTIGAGIAWPSYIAFFNPKDPGYQDKWTVPYDPAKAKQYLAQAGYPNGFKISIYGQSDTPIRVQTANVVAGFWRNIGLNVTVDSYPYATFRPHIVDRSADEPFVNSCDDGRTPRPMDWPIGSTLTSATRGGFSCGVESPFIAQSFEKASKEADATKRIATNNAVGDYLLNEMLIPSTITFPTFFMYNPNSVASWLPNPSLSGPFDHPNLIVPARG